MLLSWWTARRRAIAERGRDLRLRRQEYLLSDIASLPDDHWFFADNVAIFVAIRQADPQILAHLATRPSAVVQARSHWYACVHDIINNKMSAQAATAALALCMPPTDDLALKIAKLAYIRFPIPAIEAFVKTGNIHMLEEVLAHPKVAYYMPYVLEIILKHTSVPVPSQASAVRFIQDLQLLWQSVTHPANRAQIVNLLIRTSIGQRHPYADEFYCALPPALRDYFGDAVAAGIHKHFPNGPIGGWDPMQCFHHTTWFHVLSRSPVPSKSIVWPDSTWAEWISMARSANDYSFFLPFLADPTLRPPQLLAALSSGNFPVEGRAYLLSHLPHSAILELMPLLAVRSVTTTPASSPSTPSLPSLAR